MKMKMKFHLKHKELIYTLALTDFKLRYHGSILGYFWALLKPLLIFLILNFVFTNLFSSGVKNYSLQLLTGIIIWNFFAEGSMTGLNSLMAKASILSKAYIPKYIIIIASSLNVVISFLLNLIVLGIFFAYYHVTPNMIALIYFLFYMILTYILIVGLSLLTAPLFLKFRDLVQIWEVLLNAGFYAAPIIYPLSIIPEQYHKYLFLNPMSFIIQYSKAFLIEGTYINHQQNLTLALIIGFIFIVGLLFFKKTQAKCVENI